MLPLSSTVTSSVYFISSWKMMFIHINCFLSVTLFIFGVIGNILNILVLYQRSLRSNPCAWLFLASSATNVVVLISGLSTRIVSTWTFDLTETIDWLCKLRIFTLYVSRTIASWLIVVACIDRWLLSCLSVRHRRMSSLKCVQRETTMVVMVSLCLYLPLFYCYEANLKGIPLKCYTKILYCRIFADQVYTCITIVLPLIFMLLFGFMTMSNVRRSKRRFESSLLPTRSNKVSTNEYRQRFRRIDRHLLIMLLVQISFQALFTLPQAIQQTYLTATQNSHKSTQQHAVEDALYSFTISLTYMASGMPFYIYTLSGGCVFRQAFFSFIKRIKSAILCKKNKM